MADKHRKKSKLSDDCKNNAIFDWTHWPIISCQLKGRGVIAKISRNVIDEKTNGERKGCFSSFFQIRFPAANFHWRQSKWNSKQQYCLLVTLGFLEDSSSIHKVYHLNSQRFSHSLTTDHCDTLFAQMFSNYHSFVLWCVSSDQAH